MPIKIIDGDLFSTDAKIIVHQVNCMGEMVSGVALQVKKKFPHVYEEYLKVCNENMLGKIQLVPIDKQYIGIAPGMVIRIPEDEQYICNMFSQENYGYDGKQYTSLDAMKKCFKLILGKTYYKNNLYNAKIAMPYKIGCVRGGANWGEVYNIIEEVFENRLVELYRLDKG